MEPVSNLLALPPILNQNTIPNLIRSGVFALAKSGQPLTIDATALQCCDGTGVAFLWMLMEQSKAGGGTVYWNHLPENVTRQLETYAQACEVAALESRMVSDECREVSKQGCEGGALEALSDSNCCCEASEQACEDAEAEKAKKGNVVEEACVKTDEAAALESRMGSDECREVSKQGREGSALEALSDSNCCCEASEQGCEGAEAEKAKKGNVVEEACVKTDEVAALESRMGSDECREVCVKARGGSGQRVAFLPKGAPQQNIITALGAKTCQQIQTFGEAVAFLGEVLWRLPLIFSKRFRWGDTFSAFLHSGAEAVPVVMLIGFLLGLILAFQSAIPLQMFGAEGFVGGLVGIALVRELGLIITAILMAGRTASAFAAELGTMKVNEEIDALETMGIAPVRFLVLPRILAGTVSLPLLALFATASGLLGGWLVMHILGFSASYFIDQLRSFVSLKDLIGSECKAIIFGFTVATVGCWFGLKAGRDASAVGTATTSAVVTGIVLLATLEGIFSVIFYAMGW